MSPAGERHTAFSPSRLLVSVFLAAIGVGTALLVLPWAHAEGQVGLLDALFTATSAVCVTGLVVVDTGTAFTPFGQLVILGLIQIGGLGIMTFAAVAFRLRGSRIPLSHRAAVEESLFQREMAVEFANAFRQILWIVLVTEGLGALVLFFSLANETSALHAAWSALFHSVSAFCNAGFSLYRDNLAGQKGNSILLATVMILVTLGGLGHVVLLELWREFRRIIGRRQATRIHRFSFHTRVVLAMSIGLTAFGAAVMWSIGLEKGDTSFVDIALFHSVSARTAGFNTVDMNVLPMASLTILVVLMTIGGSPGSCAGGIKTTSLAIWLARLRGSLFGREHVSLFGRTIPPQLSLRVTSVIGLSVIWSVAGVMILTETEPDHARLIDIIFEQASAFGTVGLSTGLTPKLSVAGRIWIIASMFVGRLGPLTLALSFVKSQRPRVGYAEGKVMIG